MAALTSCSRQLGVVEKRSTTWEIAAFYVFLEVEKRNDFHLMGVALKESWTTMVPLAQAVLATQQRWLQILSLHWLQILSLVGDGSVPPQKIAAYMWPQ